MAKILISPSKYLQGAGEMKNLGTYAAKSGKKALVLISKGGYKRIGKTIEESFAESTCEVVFDYFNGECCNSEIDRLVKIVKDEQCDLTIGIGGGKIFDTAKAVAYYAGTPVFICPTIASTDAPCSALSVIYTEEGVFEKYLFLPANPNLVLMDTDIITKSRFVLLWLVWEMHWQHILRQGHAREAEQLPVQEVRQQRLPWHWLNFVLIP